VEKIDGMGKFLVPGVINLNAHVGTGLIAYLYSGVTAIRSVGVAPRPASDAHLFVADAIQADSPEAARQQVETSASRQVDAIQIPLGTKPAVADAILDEARKFNIPVTAEIDSLADTKRLVNAGAAGFVHMIQDTEDIDDAFLARLRDLRIVFTPTLVAADGEHLDRALRNTAKLAAAGVSIGVGSASGSTQRELELLAQAGLSPMDVVVAATRTGAWALRRSDDLGTIEPGRVADLILLSANPLDDVRNLSKIDRLMVHGDWVDRDHLPSR